MKIKTVLFTAVILTLLSLCTLFPSMGVSASDVTSVASITSEGKDLTNLRDEKPSEEENTNGRYTYSTVKFSAGDTIKISHSEKITGVYVIWQKVYGEWNITADGKNQICGKNGFLHEYVALENPSAEIVLNLPSVSSEICQLYVFTEGELPSWVQVWNPPCEKADLMLLSTHSDDEHLFFAGVLPTYAGEKNLKVQVVYLTNHWDTKNRPHEQINGLWAVGVRNYPIVGTFPDDADTLGKKGEAVSVTLERSKNIFGAQKLIDFQVEMLERFKPQVVIAHDIEGEYKHGAHMANTWSLQEALEKSTWNVPKTYIHLYNKNTVTMDWDKPLSAYGGMTAFEVSKLGYACHDSQHWTWFTRWLQGDGINSSKDIATYSPCKYGLYRTTVGNDTGKNDFMENITPYQDPTPAPTPTTEPAPTKVPDKNVKDPVKAEDNTIWITVLLLISAAAVILFTAVKSSGKKQN